MPSDYPRSHRVGDFIQRELAGIIARDVKDPRLSPMLTISAVEVSRDLSVAKVYYSLLDSDEQPDTQTALVSAGGFLRKQLARQMNTRTVPQLRFIFDDSAQRGAHMSALIADAVATNTTSESKSETKPESGVASGAEPGTEHGIKRDIEQEIEQEIEPGAKSGKPHDSGGT